MIRLCLFSNCIIVQNYDCFKRARQIQLFFTIWGARLVSNSYLRKGSKIGEYQVFVKLNSCTNSHSNWAEFQQKLNRNSTEIQQNFNRNSTEINIEY